ncbi:hypothetical protein [Mucilaginibacter humi]|nr:hypothetical protein [Mucilaginibacter humi]
MDGRKQKAFTTLVVGIVTIILSVILVGYGNNLKDKEVAKTAQVEINK